MQIMQGETDEASRTSWALASGALLLFVLALVLLGDERVFSGSDAGGKAATVAAMAERGTEGADLGYWAETVDPEGVHHPFFNTERHGVGWVQVTSSAMPLASSLGERVAGAAGALWVSIIAVPIGALGATRLARNLGARTGMVAFLIMGTASPLAFYGADQWEHAPALAAGIWAAALLGENHRFQGFVALGIAAGLAGSLRRETAIVLLVLGVGELFDSERRRYWLSNLPGAGVAAGAAGLVLAAVYRLDSIVLGQSLSGRSADQVGAAGTDVGQRLYDGVLTTVSQYSNLDLPYLMFGLLTLAGVVLASWGWTQDDESSVRIGAAMVVASIVIRYMVGGLTFVSGAFAALPVAAAAPVLARRAGRRVMYPALGSVVLVVLVQWTGSLGAQWGGRYLLLPAAVVAIVALAEIERRGWRHPAAVVSLGATVAIALIGLMWHIERTNTLGESRDAILSVAEGDVVISTHAHFPREIAQSLDGERWLAGPTLDLVANAFDMAERVAPGERVWLLHPGANCEIESCDRRWENRSETVELVGWQSNDVVTIPWLGDGTYVLESFEPH